MISRRSSPRHHGIRPGEIVALCHERLAAGLGEGVAEAVAIVQPGWMPSLAGAIMRLHLVSAGVMPSSPVATESFVALPEKNWMHLTLDPRLASCCLGVHI